MSPQLSFNAFWLALQFLTRIPTPKHLTYCALQWGQSVLFFPIVGFILGILLTLSAHLLEAIHPLFAAALLTSLWVILTGALHLDGFADTIDAWVGGMGDKEKTLAIMKDPTSGPMAVTALILLLLLKFTAIYSLIIAQHSDVLLWLPLIARSQLILLLLTTPYAKKTGMGYEMQQHLPKKTAWGVFWFIVILLLFLTDNTVIWAFLSSLIFLMIYRRALCQRLNGITGDTLGAWVEISEIILLSAVILFGGLSSQTS